MDVCSYGGVDREVAGEHLEGGQSGETGESARGGPQCRYPTSLQKEVSVGRHTYRSEGSTPVTRLAASRVGAGGSGSRMANGGYV